MNPESLTILVGLTSAVSWGAADFLGGLAARRSSPYSIVIFGHLGSLFLLIPAALLLREFLPPARDWLLGMLSGAAGGAGLLLLYRSLAEGQMSLASPVSALVAAALPVLVGMWTDGLPAPLMLAGFALALVAIWLIAQAGPIGLDNLWKRLRMPVIAGICFGVFFIGIHAASSQAVFWPLAATRLGSIPSLLAYSLLTRREILPARRTWGGILLISLLDSLGNLLYMLAANLGRMDLAAVLGSLYPGSTVALARIVLKEKLTRGQWLGVVLALIALALISM